MNRLPFRNAVVRACRQHGVRVTKASTIRNSFMDLARGQVACVVVMSPHPRPAFIDELAMDLQRRNPGTRVMVAWHQSPSPVPSTKEVSR